LAATSEERGADARFQDAPWREAAEKLQGRRFEDEPEGEAPGLAAAREVGPDGVLDLVPEDAAIRADLELAADELRVVEDARVHAFGAQPSQERARVGVVLGSERGALRPLAQLGIVFGFSQQAVEKLAHDLVFAVAEHVAVGLELLVELDVARDLLVVVA